MVRRRKSQLVLFLSLQAMAVAIICFGSLINFHQYKIWGKPLIPNFVGYKRDVEKFSKTVSFGKVFQSKFQVPQHSDFDFYLPFEVNDAHLCPVSSPYHLSDPWSGSSQSISANGLRGPPLS